MVTRELLEQNLNASDLSFNITFSKFHHSKNNKYLKKKLQNSLNLM